MSAAPREGRAVTRTRAVMPAHTARTPRVSAARAPGGTQPRRVPARVIRARRIWVALIGAVVLGVAAPQAFASDDSDVAPMSAFDTYTVAPGETLWSIASALTTPGRNVHDTVATIQELNQMPSSALLAGEQLFIPVAD